MIINKFAKWMLCAGLAAAAGTVEAGPIEFDFKDPKKVNNVVFLLDAPLESINGTATGISGKVSFDPIKPESTAGKIVLDASSLHVDNRSGRHTKSERTDSFDLPKGSAGQTQSCTR